jgi:hypothetical protein
MSSGCVENVAHHRRMPYGGVLTGCNATIYSCVPLLHVVAVQNLASALGGPLCQGRVMVWLSALFNAARCHQQSSFHEAT